MVKIFGVLFTLAVVHGCAGMKPSEIPGDLDFIVAVKTSQLPEGSFPKSNAHHTFFDLKKGSEDQWFRCELMSSGARIQPIEADKAREDARFWSREVEVLELYEGERARKIIEQLEALAPLYEDSENYRAWPGPNSNTFAARMSHEVPELDFEFDHNAVGKDYAEIVRVGGTTTGSEVEFETPVLGLQLGLEEGVELHFLQLTFGISLFPPAIKLPFLPRIGFD